jgi:hypothetical protein
VEGLLKDSDKLYTYVHCTVPSVASESLSNAPRSICPLVAPDFVRQSQGTPLPPPSPPPRRQTLIVDGEGEWGVEVWRHHSDTRFWGKEKIRVKGKGRPLFSKIEPAMSIFVDHEG